MKPTRIDAYIKQVIPLLLLIAVSVVIWQVGPRLVIMGVSPLSLPQSRFYIIAILFLTWLIKFLFFDLTSPVKEIFSPDDVKKIQTLQGRFYGAIHFLKKTFISKYGKNLSLSQLPWVLLVGTSGSGKTTLLAHSNINFILSKQFKTDALKSISASSHCDWWTTRDLVFVDVPSHYITPDRKKTKAETPVWRHLLKLIAEHHRRPLLSGIMVALQLPELLKKNNLQQRKQTLRDIKQALIQLHEKLAGQCPIYIIITKCDLIPGFTEFFSDSSSDELAQAWGVTLPTLKENEKTHDVFIHRFNALIKRLNSQLIWRLHQERHPQARSHIKDFPLQLERLKESMAHFLKALMAPGFFLQGVYLTSAVQPLREESASSTTLTHNALPQGLQLARFPTMASRSYFIRQLLLQGLSHSQDHSQPVIQSNDIWRRRIVYAASVSAIVISAILLGHDFQYSVQQVNSLQTELAQYQLYVQTSPQKDQHLIKALPMLNALQDATLASNRSLSHWMKALSFYSNKSQKTVQTVYTQALQTVVLPEIKTLLERTLKGSHEKNPGQSYKILKAYLMLGDATHMDPVFVESTIKELLTNALSAQETDQLGKHIAITFSSVWHPMSLNNNLIAQVRRQLSSLSSLDMGFAILASLNGNSVASELKLGINKKESPIFLSKVVNQVPHMYTASAFQAILTHDVVNVATETLQGNWVLGEAAVPIDPVTLHALAEQLRVLYISKYVDVWEVLLSNIQVIAPKNLAQLYAMVVNLTSNNSPLLQLLQTIQQNTAFEPILMASPKLQSLNILLASANSSEQNTVYRCFVALRQVSLYLQTLLHHPDVGNAAFEAIKARLQNANESDPINELEVLATQSPEPLRTWLHALYVQSRRLLLQESVRHLAIVWKNDIADVYRSQFMNRYPLNQQASQDIDLQNFADLLGQQGKLSHFYQTYLKPLVNESGKKWQWRSIDNMTLPFSNVALEKIQNAMKFQRAFFPNGDNQLFVQFSLEPMSVDATVKNIMLNMNGQDLAFQKQHNSRTLTWPGPHSVHATTVQLIGRNNERTSRVIPGDWGWFRLVTQSTHEVLSPRQLILNISVNGRSAKYMLHTQGTMNPFLPLNLASFELPERLV